MPIPASSGLGRYHLISPLARFSLPVAVGGRRVWRSNAASQRGPPGDDVPLSSLTAGTRPLRVLARPNGSLSAPPERRSSRQTLPPWRPWRRWRSTGLEVKSGLSAPTPRRHVTVNDVNSESQPCPGSWGADFGLQRPRRYHPDIAASEISRTPFWEPIRPKRVLILLEPAPSFHDNAAVSNLIFSNC